MNPPQAEKADMRKIVSYLLNRAARETPQEFKAFFLGGVVSNTVAHLPDEYFEQLVRTEPCGRPGCDCHLVAKHAENFLREIRLDHQRYAGFVEQD